MKLVAEAFAKVNRSLVVLGKRPDGYHELDTVFQAVGLTDRLTFEESDLLTLEVDDPSIPAGAENLVLRAARALAEAAGIRPRAAITLEKRIPSGGGLGGGSSDAAVTLLGLSALWELDLPLELLSRVGGGARLRRPLLPPRRDGPRPGTGGADRAARQTFRRRASSS